MLLVARHKAHKNTSECARACELSPSFLNRIEAGLRTPELERCPAIANAYGIPAGVLCWTWIGAWAPSAVPHLATSIDFEANPTMVEYLRSQYAEQQAVEEATRKAENDILPEQDKLLTEIINGCTVIRHNPPAERIFELIRRTKVISKKQIAEEVEMDIALVREIARLLDINGLIWCDNPKLGWVTLSHIELLRICRAARRGGQGNG